MLNTEINECDVYRVGYHHVMRSLIHCEKTVDNVFDDLNLNPASRKGAEQAYIDYYILTGETNTEIICSLKRICKKSTKCI